MSNGGYPPLFLKIVKDKNKKESFLTSVIKNNISINKILKTKKELKKTKESKKISNDKINIIDNL